MRNLVIVTMLAFCLCSSGWGAVWHVDKENASGTENGLTWGTAYRTIQAAINAAAFYDEVWVKEGVYDEARDSSPIFNTGSLVMKDSVNLYGGFIGTELSKLERTSGIYSTIDGSMARNSGPALHVVFGKNDTVFDGFWVTGGSNGLYNSGCTTYINNCVFQENLRAVVNDDSRCTIENCAFTGNIINGIGTGGALYNTDSVTEISSCFFVKNQSHGYGAIYNDGTSQSSITIEKCIFEENYSAGWGGAINNSSDIPIIKECLFIGNSADGSGGALCGGEYGQVINCIFYNNHSGRDGGALYFYGAQTQVVNCLFEGNVAENEGGVLYASSMCSPDFINCTLVGNSANQGSCIYSESASSVLVLNSILWGNGSDIIEFSDVSEVLVRYSDVEGGFPGIGNINLDPLFVEPENGNYRLQWGSPCIDIALGEDAPETDLLGISRPQGDGIDMGAYEFILGDNDGDGMDDNWEQNNGLDPENPEDANTDLDGDGLSNYDEFLAETNPQDPSDPPNGVYVSGTGSDVAGDGSSTSPWATIGKAMAEVGYYSAYQPITIHVSEGIYEEPVFFAENVSLVGGGPSLTKIQFYDPTDDEHVVVTGAAGTSIQDCTIRLAGFYTTSTVLLRIDDVNMNVQNVVLDGNDNLFSLGVLISGTGSSESVIEDSTFRRLHFGVQAVNTGVNITGNTFDGIRGDAVFVRLPDVRKNGEVVETPLLGDAQQSTTTGNNQFVTVLGAFVVNTSSVLTKAENNDWGVYTQSEIAAKMQGNVDYEPFIGDTDDGPRGCTGASIGSNGAGRPKLGDLLIIVATGLLLGLSRKRLALNA